jgi:hypothetical protein
LTKQEYGEVCDVFTNALRAVEGVAEQFIEDAVDEGFEYEDESVASVLDRRGNWITGDEYRRVESAIELLETLVGRAHKRAT